MNDNNRPEQAVRTQGVDGRSRAQVYHSDPPMGDMVDDGQLKTRVNKLAGRDTSYLDTHAEQLNQLLDHFERSNQQLYNTLAKMRGYLPETAEVGCDACDPSSLQERLNIVTDRLQVQASLFDRQADELGQLI